MNEFSTIRIFLLILLFPLLADAQLEWRKVDDQFGPLPSSVHVYFTDRQIDTGKFRAFYVVADLKDRKLDFTTDTSANRRLTPSQFFEKNSHPLLVVNCTFFSFETNQNLNAVVRNGRMIAYNVHSLPGRGKDTFTYRHSFTSVIGIDKKRKADVAWLLTDSFSKYPMASQNPVENFRDSLPFLKRHPLSDKFILPVKSEFWRWKMQTAVGGGPALLQNGEIRISNNEELKFSGKAINDKHPRTAMGYTRDGKLIILVIEGRNPNAGGATLAQEAQIFKDLGCAEALNLDGGGSSCLLINGKETIKTSDKEGQRPVPGVFIIKEKR